jgi:hypothetical protein
VTFCSAGVLCVVVSEAAVTFCSAGVLCVVVSEAAVLFCSAGVLCVVVSEVAVLFSIVWSNGVVWRVGVAIVAGLLPITTKSVVVYYPPSITSSSPAIVVC